MMSWEQLVHQWKHVYIYIYKGGYERICRNNF